MAGSACKLPVPANGVVDVWQISLGETVAREEAHGSIGCTTSRVSPRAVVGRRSAAAHAAARRILGRYLGLPPGSVDIVRAPCPVCGEAHGKPRLNGQSLEFSLSHSHERALLAVCAEPVGVDVEWVGASIDLEHVAPAVLAAHELDALHTSSQQRRVARFLELWTRKEAVTKLIGLGLSQDLRDVRISPDGSYACVSGPASTVERFALAEPHVLGYAAAVAAAARSLRVRMHEWRDA